ncbi:MAG TPA: PilZ domain-containing protein [Bryobacteraceae bacterium]|nr:PilZ domain-containing protein [Bryobacteraceae bacterium]
MGDTPPGAERRLRRRVRVRWPLFILKGPHGADVLSTVTENLSSRGFFCMVDQALAPGESLVCMVRLPLRHDLHIPQALRCQAQVIWVKAMDDGRFGIGCCVDDYIVVA